MDKPTSIVISFRDQQLPLASPVANALRRSISDSGLRGKGNAHSALGAFRKWRWSSASGGFKHFCYGLRGNSSVSKIRPLLLWKQTYNYVPQHVQKSLQSEVSTLNLPMSTWIVSLTISELFLDHHYIIILISLKNFKRGATWICTIM